jgi:putative nucleotidyltransferase with HDIG domain
MSKENNSPLPQAQPRSIVELTLGFDATVEAFSRALDIREGETIGHTRQVTEVAVNLANEFGLKGPDLTNIRQGALLHDIGKMGVPESILKKEAPLSKEEWAIVRMHPQYAYDLLVPIVLLHSAIDIPYYHHEKWDGSGYPQGLKGNKIPLAARIFAVVHVWDALTSDRPYRKAWSELEASKYLQEQAGKYFDPAIVHAFLDANIRRKVTRPLVR